MTARKSKVSYKTCTLFALLNFEWLLCMPETKTEKNVPQDRIKCTAFGKIHCIR